MKTLVVATGLVLLAGCDGNFKTWPEARPVQFSAEVSSDEKAPYPERVNAAKKKLQKQLEAKGLSRIAEPLINLMMPSIRVMVTRASKKDLTVGSSRLGGTPDLPEDIAWPECNGVPMALLAQFRLQDIAACDIDRRLPKKGMLYFFYDTKKPAGYGPEDKNSWKVIYFDGDFTKLRPKSQPLSLPEEIRFRACKVTFVNEITFPSWDSDDIEKLKLSQNEHERYFELPGTGAGEGKPIHRILGYPDQIQGNMQLDCQLALKGLYADYSGNKDPRAATLKKEASDWQLLLQIDSDVKDMNTMWGDMGRVYFWIREQDLKKRDFSNVWLMLQCY